MGSAKGMSQHCSDSTIEIRARGATPDGLSDEELMASVQGGDGDAFAVLFDRYNRLVLTVALKISTMPRKPKK